MSRIEIRVPMFPESVTDATIAKWYKKEGESISQDENLVDLETDKIMLEVPAPKDGIIKKIKVKEGHVVKSREIIAILEEADEKGGFKKEEREKKEGEETIKENESDLSPAVRRLVTEKSLNVREIEGSGKEGRITKKDVEDYLENHKVKPVKKEVEAEKEVKTEGRTETRFPLSRIRQRIAERLVQIQKEAALLTTFNEINMRSVIDLRKKYRDEFEKRHKVRLGFMSFFTKASVEALKRFPMVNSSIDENNIICHNYYDIGIAVGTERGLVVPVLRNTENMSMAGIEKQIREYASRAQEGRLGIEELTGGTFTITNGGIYGSLLSTPIINPPQTAILGMHKIEDRSIVEDGEIVIRPIMLVALSYDHRVIDGREAVLFLVTVKELLEDPARMVLGV